MGADLKQWSKLLQPSPRASSSRLSGAIYFASRSMAASNCSTNTSPRSSRSSSISANPLRVSTR